MSKKALKNDAVINLRIRRTDLVLIDQAAKVEGKTRSQFLRDCMERAVATMRADFVAWCGNIVDGAKRDAP